MGFYDEAAVLAAIDDHTALVLMLCGGALVCNVIWFVLGLMAGERDRSYCTALLAICVFLPNDAGYVYRYQNWFDERDHWFPQLFWVALCAMVAFELLFLRQILRYGHRELLPWLTRTQFQAAVLLAVATSFVGYEMAKQSLADPLYLGAFQVLILLSPVLGAGLLTRRRTSAGQSVTMWLAYTGMAALWTIGSTIGLGGDMRDGLWIACGATSVAWGLGLAYLISRAPTAVVDVPIAPTATGALL